MDKLKDINTLKDLNEREIARVCGRKIKYLREQANYSQEKLAELLECSEVSIGRVERGVQTMKFWRLVRLCEVFHVSLDYLMRDFDSTDIEPVPSYLVQLFHDADPVELEILSDHMMSAGREIDRKHKLELALGHFEQH